jgi:hypothetical protein
MSWPGVDTVVEPVAFQWTYDRSAWDDRPEASTFSVGIYQWLPKAAGGLKTPTTIRVNGYVADAAAVYAKADELCERLNREGARPDPRPPWLQKSYSIAKPAGFEKPRRSADLTAAEARAVRNRVVKPLLRAAGYVQAHASTFACRRGEIVRVLNFQTFTFGPKFTVNLGLHPTFVPVGRDEPRRLAWTEVDELQCTVRGRIGFSLPRQLDMWWPFGSDPVALAKTYAEVTDSALDILERQATVVERWCERPSGSLSRPMQWMVSYPTTLLACAAMRAGRLDLAESQLRTAIESAIDAGPEWYRALLQSVHELRAAQGDPARTAELLQWLTG